jgi:hypothetical protein
MMNIHGRCAWYKIGIWSDFQSIHFITNLFADGCQKLKVGHEILGVSNGFNVAA